MRLIEDRLRLIQYLDMQKKLIKKIDQSMIEYLCAFETGDEEHISNASGIYDSLVEEQHLNYQRTLEW